MSKPISHGLAASSSAVEYAAARAQEYLATLNDRGVAPSSSALAALGKFRGTVPEGPSDVDTTLEMLDSYGSPATVASAGGRFFGLVVGGSLPATVGARVLSSAWDQVVFSDATSPVGVALEETAGDWVLDLLGLAPSCSVGLVTGTTMGSVLCLAAARHELLARAGWSVEEQGMVGAPPIQIVATEQLHVTVKKALSILGFGTNTIDWVPADSNGSMMVSAMPQLSERCLVLVQAGNVESGAFDPVGRVTAAAANSGAWVHVDGAFGLWAAASPQKRSLVEGFENADSWVTDGHKMLNTPYDCGIAICKHPRAVHAAMATVAPFLEIGQTAAPKDMVPEFSRSARGVELWAALHSLGRSGVADLVDRCCENATRAARGLQRLGFDILNDVVFNQVVATLPGRQQHMTLVAEKVRESGDAWFGASSWQGQAAIRLSFSSWLTTTADIDRTIAAIEAVLERLSQARVTPTSTT